MKNRLARTCAVLLLLLSSVLAARQASDERSAPPHDVVGITDPHGNVQVQTFLMSLIRDSRVPTMIDDVVIETASARSQDALDRFVRGDEVPRDALRQAWENHTVANNLGVHAEELIRAVRAINASLSGKRRLRVLAGDPPIDWDNIAPGDGRRWIELRDSYPADLVRRQVLDRGRRALLLYGQGHLQRRQSASNYDMSTWQSQTVVSLLERDHSARVFNVWTFNNDRVPLPDGVASWPVPSLATVRGTTLGARDFDAFSGGFGLKDRFGVRNDQLVPLPRAEWKVMRMDDQFDAVLYLGPPSAMTNVTVPAEWCRDADFVARRLQRLTRFGNKTEVERFRKACAI